MKRSTALEMSANALGVEMLPSNNDHILAMADVLQRECDLREGLIEIARVIITDAMAGNLDSQAAARWRGEYLKLSNAAKQ